MAVRQGRGRGGDVEAGALLPVVGVRGTFLVGGVLTLSALTVLAWPAPGPSRSRAKGQGSGSAVGTCGD